MAVKILAVDDSATMRQILEMTFAGEDAEVTTVESGQQAVDAASRLQPDVVLADASMTGMDGYAVAQAVKANGVAASVVILSSQHTPYDEAKGKASGVDDHIAKPFDSQVVIDKVTKLAASKPAVASKPPQTQQGAASVPSAPTPAKPPARPTPGRSSKRTMAFGTTPMAPPQPPAPPKPAAAAPPKRPVLELADEPEIDFDDGAAQAPAAATPPKPAAAAPPKPAPAKPAAAAPPKPAPAKPVPAKPAAAAAAAPAAAVAAATQVGSPMATQLSDLGLSKEQVEAVLALSREVVEQVVWEVVPDLAETLIKEEIARLTKE